MLDRCLVLTRKSERENLIKLGCGLTLERERFRQTTIDMISCLELPDSGAGRYFRKYPTYLLMCEILKVGDDIDTCPVTTRDKHLSPERKRERSYF